jgi:RNA polymerase sigma-70 factor (ECF subfamily)
MHAVDQETLSRLLDQHGAALVLYAQQLCNRPEDVVQEAFIRLMQQRSAPENLAGWLYRVVRNEATNSSRSAMRRRRHERSAAAGRPESWFVPSGEDKIDALAAVAVLESLPIDQREIVVLRIWGGQSFDEIAELIGKSTSTAHRRYEMALESLRAKWSVSCLDKNT